MAICDVTHMRFDIEIENEILFPDSLFCGGAGKVPGLKAS